MTSRPIRPTLYGRPGTVVVVPCFNEEHRIDEEAFVVLAEQAEMHLLFVNDGSTDGTERLLDRLQVRSGQIDVLTLPRNMGKGEAVRLGLQRAIATGVPVVGYLDADLSTPGSELLRMLEILADRPEIEAVFGSRIARLGSRIRRSAIRHYTGRMFATVASLALGVAVYDTQCGAKVFRVNEQLQAAVAQPFRSPWSFDVILCQRMFDGIGVVPGLPPSSFVEMPLREWNHRDGSSVSVLGSAHALWDVVVLGVARRTKQSRGSQRYLYNVNEAPIHSHRSEVDRGEGSMPTASLETQGEREQFQPGPEKRRGSANRDTAR
jgi:dolichyl-phosphate beta-glucosyltransferase